MDVIDNISEELEGIRDALDENTTGKPLRIPKTQSSTLLSR